MSKNPNSGLHRIYLLSIAVSVLVVYISAIHADYLPIDDGGILQAVQSGTLSISDLFLGGGKEYYRPLAILSLRGDFYLFGGKIAGYHLVNILLHLCNALLVYRLALLFLQNEKSAPFYSFLAALLFALHPVSSEAVIWIACRPDLLCCFFSLLCLMTTFLAEKFNGPALFTYLFFFFLCSLLAKEAAFFLPIIIAFSLFLERKKLGQRKLVTAIAAVTFTVFVYLLLRKGLPHLSAPIRPITPENGGISSLTVIDAVAAFGFYLRKLLYPFPLNFTITEINSLLYVSLFPIFTATAMFLWKKDSAFRVPIVFLATSLIPPVGAMLLLPLWAPYAERYLYLPSVAFSLCVVVLFRCFGKQIPRYIIVTCILALALPTSSRARLWTNPILFWQEAVAKAPNFGTARLVLASEYLKAGQYAKADENLRLAIRLGLPRKARESSLEIRKQLDEKTGVSAGKPLKACQSIPPPATSLVR
ncbi:MAG: tetratricopeptide repeat protein [Geobacteraceae bacterium]